MLADSRCDAVVLDLQLRQGNGLAVLKALRASPVGQVVTVIVLTNFAFPHFRDRSLKLGRTTSSTRRRSTIGCAKCSMNW